MRILSLYLQSLLKHITKLRQKTNTKQMRIEPHTLKSLNGQLARGEKAELVRITGYSRVTVDDVLNGKIKGVTEAVRKIAAAATKLIKERTKKDEVLKSELNSVTK